MTRLTDEQVAYMAGFFNFGAAIPTVAGEVQMWRALVNGGPCETCRGQGFNLSWTREHGSVRTNCPDCTDGTRPGLIARLEAVDHGLSYLRTNEEAVAKERVAAIISELRETVQS